MDYQSNSHKSKEPQRVVKNSQSDQKEIKKVVKTAATTKKNEVRKFTDIFISEDVGNVKEYLIKDMLVPTVKKAIIGALDMILNGDRGHYGSRPEGSYISYNKRYPDPRDSRPASPQVRSRFDYDDVAFNTRGEAEAALAQMRDVVDRYGVVTVADLYDMADITQPYTSNRYGWTSRAELRNADIQRVMGGKYIIRLPRATPID